MPFSKIKKVSLIVALVFFKSQAAFATTYQGTINSVTDSGANNESFRVTLSPGIAGCGSYNFAYLNTTDNNYQAKVSTLLLAYSLNKLVYLQTVVDPYGFCQITDLGILPQ